jgi:hypothetical protein
VIPAALAVLGLSLLTAAASMVAVPLGLSAGGASALSVAYVLAYARARRAEGRP